MNLLRVIILIAMTLPNYWGQQKVVVMIDPGHGANDPGHLSSNKNHLSEKEINLKIAKKMGDYLTTLVNNIEVVYTRTDDSYPTLDQRVEMANSKKVDLFISIHCNANANKKVHGTETHVHDQNANNSLGLAKIIEQEFSKRVGRKSRGIKDHADREGSLQVLKFTTMTSVLVECGFLTNEKDANFLNSNDGQDLIASALYRSVKKYVKEKYPKINIDKTISKETKSVQASSGNSYSIQIMSSINPIESDDASFKKLPFRVQRISLNTSSKYKYIYYCGDFNSKEQAQVSLQEIKSKGFKDAFVVKK